MEAAYHQIPLEKNSQASTTVITHVGTFKYTVMPFGLKTAPSAFQRVMADVLMGCEGTLCYLDDILVASKDQETPRQGVDGLKKRLDGVGIISNEDKSMYEGTMVDWLGYELSGDGIRAAKESTEKIMQLQMPTNIKEVRRVLGVVNYYRRFIPKMNDLAMPIQALLKKQSLTKWKWSEECDDVLNKINTMINKREALAPFETDEKKKVILSCDASDVGMGAVLEQEQADGTMRPVLYWSSQFRKYERNYSVSEKEALACGRR